MTNAYHNGRAKGGKGAHTASGYGRAPAATVNEKPGFSKAQVPGDTQRNARNGGVKKCPVYPDSKGL
jgi:hypothetical protein